MYICKVNNHNIYKQCNGQYYFMYGDKRRYSNDLDKLISRIKYYVENGELEFEPKFYKGFKYNKKSDGTYQIKSYYDYVCSGETEMELFQNIDNAVESGKLTGRPTSYEWHSKMNKTVIYDNYKNMLNRCYTPNFTGYSYYGGRGIRVCDEWYNPLDKSSKSKEFYNFWKWSMGNGYRDGLTLDKVDNNCDYSPTNCQWISRSENTSKISKDKLHLSEQNIDVVLGL